MEPLLRALRSGDCLRERIFSPRAFVEIRAMINDVHRLRDLRSLRDAVWGAVEAFVAETRFPERDALRSIAEWWPRIRLLSRWLSALFAQLEQDLGGRDSLAYCATRAFLVRTAPVHAAEAELLFHSERERLGERSGARAEIKALVSEIVRASGAARAGSESERPAPAAAENLAFYAATAESAYLRGARAWLENQAATLDPVRMESAFAHERALCADCMHPSTAGKLDDIWSRELLPREMEALLGATARAVAAGPPDAPAARALWRIAARAGAEAALGRALGREAAAAADAAARAAAAAHGRAQRAAQAAAAAELVRAYRGAEALLRAAAADDAPAAGPAAGPAAAQVFLALGRVVDGAVVAGERMDRCLALLLDGPPAPAAEAGAFARAACCAVSALSARDLFAEHHLRLLALRLLRRPPSEVDLAVVAELKLRFGAAFVQKMECMIADVTAAAADGFGAPAHLPAMSATVLAVGRWPAFRHVALRRVPAPIRSLEAAFESWYGAKNPSRTLLWSHAFSTVDICVRLPAFRGVATMNMVQACVLLECDARERASLADLRESLGVPAEALARAVRGLVYSQRRLLIRTPAAAAAAQPGLLEETDVFEVNDAFTSRELRFAQPCAPLDERAQESDAAERSAADQRKLQTEAIVVRIVKARKRIGVAELEGQVAEQARHFVPTRKIIKEAIASLIDREYIAREEGEQTTLVYT